MRLWIFCFCLLSLCLGAGELFRDDFPGDRPGPHWRGSGGAFSVADHTLSIRSGRDNPVLYLDGKNWKNYRVGF